MSSDVDSRYFNPLETERGRKLYDGFWNAPADFVLAWERFKEKVCRGYGPTIHPMSDLDSVLSGKTPTEILKSAHYGGFRLYQDWFWIGPGNLIYSTDALLSDEGHGIDGDRMICYMVDSRDGLGIPWAVDVVESDEG